MPLTRPLARLPSPASTGLRIGLYTPLKAAFGAGDKDHPHILRKVAAGMLSGAIAAGMCNPTDLVKTRMQAGGGGGGVGGGSSVEGRWLQTASCGS